MSSFAGGDDAGSGVRHGLRLDQSADEYAGVGSPGYFFGKENLGAFWSITKYDLGTLCFGSFLIALCAIPRLILEYVDQEMKHLRRGDIQSHALLDDPGAAAAAPSAAPH